MHSGRYFAMVSAKRSYSDRASRKCLIRVGVVGREVHTSVYFLGGCLQDRTGKYGLQRRSSARFQCS
jgi:hypothetical protein